MSKENPGQMEEPIPAERDIASSLSELPLRRVDVFANMAIWTAAITWGLFLLSVLLGIIESSTTSFLMPAIDGVWVPIFCISILSNLVSLFSGIVGLVRVIIKRKESSGIIRAVIAILLSLALFAVVVPALHK